MIRKSRIDCIVAITATLAAAIAFLIYAGLVRMIHPSQDGAFIPERSSLAAAASSEVFGAPLGMVHAGVMRYFFDELSSTEKALSEVAAGRIRPEGLDTNTRDGNGVGYILVSRFAFRYFGIGMPSVVTAMLAMMAFSAAAFLWRFRDRRALVVVVYFTALTFMLFTPLAWDPNYVKEVPIAGIRYFSLVGVLPAFHLLFEIGDDRPLDWRRPDILPLYVQVAVLVVAILVRNSAASMLGAVALGGAWHLWRSRRERPAVRLALGKFALMAVTAALLVVTLMVSFSRGYLAEGRFTETIWHRVFVSLGMSPAWPFGNLREVYDCREAIPGGLVRGPDDINGQCVFLVNIAKRGIAPDRSIANYGRQYDAALKEEFFLILRAYPFEVLSTFTYYKLQALVRAIDLGLYPDLSGRPSAPPWLLFAALANLVLAAAVVGRRARERVGPGVGPLPAVGLFAAFSMVPLMAVWAAPHTSVDFFCFVLIGAGLVLAALVAIARSPAQLTAPA